MSDSNIPNRFPFRLRHHPLATFTSEASISKLESNKVDISFIDFRDARESGERIILNLDYGRSRVESVGLGLLLHELGYYRVFFGTPCIYPWSVWF